MLKCIIKGSCKKKIPSEPVVHRFNAFLYIYLRVNIIIVAERHTGKGLSKQKKTGMRALNRLEAVTVPNPLITLKPMAGPERELQVKQNLNCYF